MRILISTAMFPNRAEPTRGMYVMNQAIAFARKHDLRVLAPVPYLPKALARGPYASYASIPAQDVIEGISVEYPRFFIVPKLLRFVHGACLAASVVTRFRQVANDFRPDVVLSFSAYPDGVAAVAMSRRLDLPVVVGCLGNDINQKARSGLQRRVIARSLQASDLVLTVCEDLKRTVEQLGVSSGKISVVPNGVARDRFGVVTATDARRKLALPGDKRIVMCVSRLSDEKGIDVLLRAFEKTATQDTALFVAGDGAHRSVLERIIERSSRGQDIHLLGAVGHADIPTWLAAADLFVLPSRREGHPNALLEAFACGLPAIATRVGGVPEIVTSDEIGTLVPPDDVDAMAKAIDTALARQWDRERIVDIAGRRTWDNVTDEIVDKIETVLEARRAA